VLRGDSYRELLANRSYRGLWLGQTLSHLGQAVIYVVVALYVYELTGLAQGISFAIALELLPWVVIGPLTGTLADYLNRKAMLVIAYLAQAGLVALLPLTTALGQVYGLVFLISLLAPVTQLVWAAALPSVAGQQLFVRGSSLGIAAQNAAYVAGPILGGWLVSLAGAKPAFWAVVACFLAAAGLTLWIRMPGPTAERRVPFHPLQIGNDLAEGLRFLVRDPVLRYLVLSNCIVSLGWSVPSVAAVVYVTDTLGLGGGQYGLLQGTMSLGIALGVYILGRYARLLPWQHLLVGGTVLAGLAYMAVAGQPRLVLLLVLWLVSGVGWAAFWIIDEALWARITPDEVRGRVYSLADAVIYLAEVGTALVGGWLVYLVGPTTSLLLAGGIVVLGAAALSATSRGYKAVAAYGQSHDALPQPPARLDQE
jgi:MFS family permease